VRVAGQWVGLGLGDASIEVRSIKDFMRRKFSYASHLTDTTLFDEPMVGVVIEMQRRYQNQGKIGAHTPGIINLETKYAMGYLTRPTKPRPVVFTVEGHLSSMWVGPAAETARLLEQGGVCRWQPVGYDNIALPFRNDTGIRELIRLLSDRNLLPPGTPWGLCCFSQGAIVGSEVMLREVFAPSGRLHWRAKDWKATLAFGNPYREKNVVAEWIPDPPRPETEGISPTRIKNTPSRWKEVARRGDLYTEVPSGAASTEHKRAIYLAVMNRWSGHPDSLLTQVMEIVQRPIPEMIAVIQAVTNGVMFLGNMSSHGGYDLKPGIEWMGRQLRSAA